MKNFYAVLLKKSASYFCLSIALSGIVFTPCGLFAQAPVVGYPNQAAYIGIPVQLSPTSSGVGAPAYGTGSVAGYVNNAYYIAYDQHGGNIYATAYTQYQTQFGVQNGQTLYRVPAGGGTVVAVGSLTNASGVAADKSGNVWVADQIAKAVYKVPYGSNTLTMVASGFNNPQGLAVDASGNVYVADRGNAALEKVPAAGGAWTTVISGLSGTNNVAIDAAGNFFISADGGIYRVPAGGSSASLYISSNAPAGVAVDPSGAVYVADLNAQRITKFPPSGSNIVLPVDQASGVAVDQSGNVFSGREFGGYLTAYKPTGGYYLATPLPPGLSFSNSTGIVSGTPTTVTAGQNYQVYAYNSTGGTPTGFGLSVANPPLPTISYVSPQTYTPGAAITPLAPASNYVAPPVYNGSAVTLGSGIVNPVGVATDSQGNVYIADDAASVNGTSGRVYMEAANGGGQSVLADGASDPTSVATDAAGDLFIADTGLIQIFEAPAGAGYITTGSPELSNIGPVAADGAGNVYTFTPGDHTIYKLPPDLSGESPFASGLSSPAAIAADLSGNVYVSDAGNNNIVKITLAGSSSVLASVQNPGPLTVDAGGNLYVANSAGNLYTIPVGTAAAMQVGSGLTNASSLAIDGNGNIYYTDINNHQVKKISPSGGYFLNRPLPAGLSCSNTTGIISGQASAASTASYSITAYNITGGTTATLALGIITLSISYSGPDTYSTGAAITPLVPASTGVDAPGYSSDPVALGSGFKFPTGVAFDTAGNVYVADENNNAVYKIPVAGGAPITLGSGFSSPLGVAVDAAGNVFVADANNNAVKEIPAGGGAIITLGSGFKVPASLALDAAGNVYVADFGNLAIKKIPAGGGTVVTLATTSTNTEGVAVDAAGNVYFGTVFGNQVKMIPAGGGAPVNVGSGFSQPRGVAIDAAGNVYIADTGNKAVKEIPAGGDAIITLGSGFSGPEGVAIDPAGNIYVGDGASAAVKKIKPVGGYFINPVLPAGLSLDKRTGIISGTPAILSPATNYTVYAYNSSSATNAVVNIATLNSQTITFNALPTETYGNADFSPGATSTNSGEPGITYTSDNTAVATIVSGNIHIAGAGTANITASQAGDATHAAAASVAQQLTVNQAPLTITANDQSMLQGRSVPELSVSYSGFVTGENAGNLTSLPSISTTGTSSSPAGRYPITASGAVTANYSITYVAGTLNITAPSADATLGALSISAGTISPVFAGKTTGYTASVANGTTSVTVTPTAADPSATLSVNGAAVASGTASGAIALMVGANTITVVVTAQDGITTQTYTIVVTRAASANAVLTSINPSITPLSPSFSAAVTSYILSVPNTRASMTVKPITSDANATVKVNGTALASGATSPPVALAEGANTTINITVTAQNGTTTKTYTVTVTRAPSANANLVSINPGIQPISPAFNAGTTGYTLSVNNSKSTITVAPVTSDANSTIKVNGTPVTPGTTSPAIALEEGAATAISIVVTAQDGTTTKTYTLTVTRAPSANAGLSGIALSNGTLSPGFATASTSYTANVANSVTGITVTPVTTDAHATITVNGAGVTSGTASAPVSLAEGVSTAINILVTAQSGTTKTYTVTVTRAPSGNALLTKLGQLAGGLSPGLTPAFASGTTSYALSVLNGRTTMTLAPVTSDAHATIKVNGIAVASGATTSPIPLAVGTNTINVVVTAQDGITTKTYTITASRAAASNSALLTNLQLSSGTLTPAFVNSTLNYTVSEPNNVPTITVTPYTTDADETVTINGTSVSNGSPSGPIALAEGAQTTITATATSADGSKTKTYTIVVSRAASTDATLSALNLSSGTLSPVFAGNTTSYTLTVPNATSSMSVTPAATDANATILVNGMAVTSGTASAPVTLPEGATTTITTVVTAQDGTTTQTYTVAVTRTASANASLISLGPSIAPLSPTFSPFTTSYTLSVANNKTSMTVTPVLSDANATIKVNGTIQASGTTSAPIALAVGQTTISVTVTAQNHTTTKTYTITVTRAAGSADNFEPISVSQPESTVTLAAEEIKVHQAISPNGDGIDDYLQIENISRYPDNKLTIMNRNGQLIYEATGYDNISKTFDGHSNKSGQMQMPGTYFYQLDYTVNGTLKQKTGFIVLKY